MAGLLSSAQRTLIRYCRSQALWDQLKSIVTALPIMTLSTQSCSPLRTLVLIMSILSSTFPRYQFISQGLFLNYLWSAQWRISEG